MGNALRKNVEQQLLNDLKQYHSYPGLFYFDWSESCIEGKRMDYLDGAVENFSGISIFDKHNGIIAHGWMDFVFDNDLIVYWDMLDIFHDRKKLKTKSLPGIPEYIWNNLSKEFKASF